MTGLSPFAASRPLKGRAGFPQPARLFFSRGPNDVESALGKTELLKGGRRGAEREFLEVDLSLIAFKNGASGFF